METRASYGCAGQGQTRVTIRGELAELTAALCECEVVLRQIAGVSPSTEPQDMPQAAPRSLLDEAMDSVLEAKASAGGMLKMLVELREQL